MSSVAAAAPFTGSAGVEQTKSQPIPVTVIPASSLSQWCDRLIEAGWLAAVIVVPLFFNIYSSRVFEPDKLTTLRSIALFMAVVWLVKWLEEFRNPNRDRSVTWRTPLVLPTLLLVVVYMISTALSVAPRTSLLGSYQRLQGTYTTFAYIVVFFMVLQGLRTRAQLDRLITLIIVTSLPIAMYGLLQRLQIDPLPWGGDTVERVAGNMGNSIFIAAYLVMTFFITLYRIADSFTAIFQSEQPKWSDVVRAACYILITLFNAIVVLVLAGSRGPQLGWLGGLLFFALLLVQLTRRRRTRLVLTVGMVGVTIAGLGFLYFLNATRNDPNYEGLRQFPLFRRLGTVLTTSEGTNAVRVLIWEGAAELVAPHDPLLQPTDSQGSFPCFAAASIDNTGRSDLCNVIRPLVGYGPESMYVAYNRFYPPQLANFEARNASPDRSHNETWDSLVITGIFGFLAYLFLFGSVLFYGFRWVGLIATRFEAGLFVVLWIAGAALFGLTAITSGNAELLGVSIGAGVVFGLTIFLFISAIINARRGDDVALDVRLSLRDQLLLIAIISAVVAHFIEIHTGIAIAATRTNFWVLIGVMVVVGAGLLGVERPGVRNQTLDTAGNNIVPAERQPTVGKTPAANNQQSTAGGTRRQRRAQQQAAALPAARRASSPSSSFVLPGWFGTVAAYGLFLGLILAIMAFDFTNNTSRYLVSGEVFVKAMTELPAGGGRATPTPGLGVLVMFLLTLGIGTVIIVAELRRNEILKSNEQTGAAIALALSVAAFIWIAFGTFIAGRLVDFISSQQGNTVGNVLAIADQLAAFPAYVYVLIAIVMVAAAFLLRREEPLVPARTMSWPGATALGVGVFALVIWPGAIATSNLQPIAADIIYKQANPWDQSGPRELVQGTGIQGWDLAIEHYRKAIQLAPNEDFYYLWLGRALLEKAKSTAVTTDARLILDDAPFTRVIDNGPQNWGRPSGSDTLPSATLNREDLFSAARIILEEARIINPLNTDHSANLARMWQQQAEITPDAALKAQRYQYSDKEYAIATRLSPNNAQLWNEWARLALFNLRDFDAARDKLDRSLVLDQKFSPTYLLRAAWHLEKAAAIDRTKDEAAWRKELESAKPELLQAIAVDPNAQQAYQELARIELQLGDTNSAISATKKLLEKSPNDWNSLKNLALIYSDTKQLDLARQYATQALAFAPADQKPVLQAFIQSLAAAP